MPPLVHGAAGSPDPDWTAAEDWPAGHGGHRSGSLETPSAHPGGVSHLGALPNCLDCEWRLVLPRGIEPPTPSLPRTCSTPELRQRYPRKAGGTCHRASHIASAMTQTAKARNKPGFRGLFHRLAKIWSCIRHRPRLLRAWAVGRDDSHDHAQDLVQQAPVAEAA